MAVRKRKGKKIIRFNRKNSKVAKIGGIILLVAVTLFVLMLTPLFNIKWLDIKGAEKVTVGQVKTAISYKQETNIFKLGIRKGEKNLMAVPYVETAKVRRKLPDGIRVKITERVPVAYMKFGGGFALIDKTGRLLEQVQDKPQNLPCLSGVPNDGLAIGQQIGDKSKDAEQAFLVIYEKLTEYEIFDRVSGINVTNSDSLSFEFDNNKTVILGDGYRLDYKLMMLQAAIEDISPSEKGTINLTVEGKAIFSPEE